jgi:hypothetical protein
VGFVCGFRLIRGVGAEHGVQDVDAAAGEADQGGVVFLALGSFPVVVGPLDGGWESDANAARKNARFNCLLPLLGGCSPRMLLPERRVTGARPA